MSTTPLNQPFEEAKLVWYRVEQHVALNHLQSPPMLENISIEDLDMLLESAEINKDVLVLTLDEANYQRYMAEEVEKYASRMTEMVTPASSLFSAMLAKLAAQELDPKRAVLRERVKSYLQKFQGARASSLLTGATPQYAPGHNEDGSTALQLQSFAYLQPPRIVEPAPIAPTTSPFDNPPTANMNWNIAYICQNSECGRESLVGVSLGLSVPTVSSISVSGPLASAIKLPAERKLIKKTHSLISILGISGADVASNIADNAETVHPSLQLSPRNTSPLRSLRRSPPSPEVRAPLSDAPIAGQHLPLPSTDRFPALTVDKDAALPSSV
ncbi:hypothetical protein DXG01_017041 [Tephrocybe rancida]|nr:hypothetical protein DXG01_017041 [Tephrocybe rancida]